MTSEAEMKTGITERFALAAELIIAKARSENRLIINPGREELRKMAEKEPGIRKTKYGSFVAESEPTSRTAPFTKNSIDHDFGQQEIDLLKSCMEALSRERLILLDRIVGNLSSDTAVRLIVPEGFAHIALGGGNLFWSPRKKIANPKYQIIFFADEAFEANKSKPLHEKDITIRLAILDDCIIKIIRNSNYIGEYKKGVFAAEDWTAKKERGGIFLHAGCREDHLQSISGDYRTVRTLLLALSANGKTTLSSRILARKSKEQSWLVQDDGGCLTPDGAFHGYEAGGIFVKTEGVNPGEQREIFYGLLRPDTLLENVFVSEDGDLDFHNYERTTNGRAVIRRQDFLHAAPFIDADKIDNIILITRGPLIPAISKLTLEQATALMIVGQAMESSAGDPTQAGKIRSEFFYDPFIAGDRARHANRFYEILKELPHVRYFLLNTGGIGESCDMEERDTFHDIRIETTMSILDSLLRGGLEEWVESPTGFTVPKAIRGVDDIYTHPEKLYPRSAFIQKQKQLNLLRQKEVEKIGEELREEIKKVFK